MGKGSLHYNFSAYMGIVALSLSLSLAVKENNQENVKEKGIRNKSSHKFVFMR